MRTRRLEDLKALAAEVPGSLRTLSRAETGTRLELVTFLSRSVRRACRALGLEEGRVVTCRTHRDAAVVLELETGRVVELPRPCADLIRVEPSASSASGGTDVRQPAGMPRPGVRPPRRRRGGAGGGQPSSSSESASKKSTVSPGSSRT